MESIFQRISDAIEAEGELPEHFSIQPEPDDSGALRFVDGARDGITFYHTGASGNAVLLAKLTELTERIAEGASYEETEPKLAACFQKADGMLHCIDGLQDWIVAHQEKLDAENLFEFCIQLLLESASIGAVKYALSVLELLAQTEGEWRSIVRLLALSDELTLFCVFVACRWKNKDEALFDIAQNVRGWGRIHAVRMLEPVSQDMRDWLLDEGWGNDVLPAYTALACAQKGGLRQRLEGPAMSREQLDAAGGLIQALLDEGPCQNISLMEDAEDLLLAYLDQVEQVEQNEQDLETLQALRRELSAQDWPQLRARLEG